MVKGGFQFKDILKINREKLGLTKSELAKIIDKTPGYISKIEGGYTPPKYEICILLCDVLSLTHDQKNIFLKLALKEQIKDDWQFIKKISLS